LRQSTFRRLILTIASPPFTNHAQRAGFGVPAFVRGIGIRQVRIACGLTMFCYLVSHYSVHALGNISFDAMAEGLTWHMAFWRSPVVTPLFYTAALTHWVLGLWALYQRRQFRYAAPELTQLILGLSIPLLLIVHFGGVRLPGPLFDRVLYYPNALNAYWVLRPWQEWLQLVLLLVAWTHGCIGLYFWLRMKRLFTRAAPLLLAFAVLLPALAWLGLVQGGRAVTELRKDPAWRAANLPLFTPPQRALLDDITYFYFPIGYASVLGLVFAARGARVIRERWRGTIKLSYPGGRTVSVPRGYSVLEASLRYRVPHASVCGGKARCSTCRIRVLNNPPLPAPSWREDYVLERVGVRSDPTVRLACQLRPDCDLAFLLLLPPQLNLSFVQERKKARIGEERYLVSMFVDLRGSTRIAERGLPFDTVFLVNRFLGAVCQAVLDAGGQPNQFLGDGLLAVFGLDGSAETACQQAIDAVARIGVNVAQLNADYASELREPIRFGIGVNGGDVIVGDVGYRDHTVFTAIGDPVNVAARLQDLTKELQCEALIADDVCRMAKLPESAAALHTVAIRGREEKLQVRAIADSRKLAPEESLHDSTLTL
jgi:adenylate cyclase